MRNLIHLINRVSEWTGKTIAWLSLAMVLVTFVVVVLRYVFDTGWIAMQESVTYMHALVFMLGAAYTLHAGGHVRVDIFYRKFGARGRAAVDLFGALCLLLPMSLYIAWVSWDYVAAAWEVMEGSREAGGLPGVFVLKSLILAMPLLLALQGLAMAVRSGLILAGLEVDDGESGVGPHA